MTIRVLILALLTLSACAIPVRWNRLQPGMLKDDVLHVAGQPDRRTYESSGPVENDSRETWYYDYKDPRTRKLEPHEVKFRDGKVTSAN